LKFVSIALEFVKQGQEAPASLQRKIIKFKTMATLKTKGILKTACSREGF
jgi:hypothetical protein